MFGLVPSLTYNLMKTGLSLYQLQPDPANLYQHRTKLVPTSGLLAGDLKQHSKITQCPKLGEDSRTGIIRSLFMVCFGLVMQKTSVRNHITVPSIVIVLLGSPIFSLF